MATTVAAPATPRAKAGGVRESRWTRRAPLLPALLFTIAITQAPFVVTLWYSMQSWNLVRPGSEHFVGLSNYVDVFADSTFRTAALNTILITGSCVVVSLLLGLGLALLLDREFIGRGVVRTLLITPFLVMPVAGALLWKTTMFDPVYGIVNFVLAPFGAGETDWVSQYPMFTVVAALVWQWTPFMMLLLLAGLQSQSKEVLEAASVDGATRSARSCR